MTYSQVLKFIQKELNLKSKKEALKINKERVLFPTKFSKAIQNLPFKPSIISLSNLTEKKLSTQ